MNFPRIALLSWCSPASRYAGGAAIRRLLSRLPPERLRWCGFHAGDGAAKDLPDYRAFPPQTLHWRLSGSFVEHAYVDWLQARAVAARMWDWLAPFKPEVLWVVPEVWAVSVGRELQRLCGLPLHATLHDAPESARYGALPRAYVPFYRAGMRRLLGGARSVDAVSEGLVAHLRQGYGLLPHCDTVVVPPSVEADLAQPVVQPDWGGPQERRIGVCGSLRQSPEQWRSFLKTLGRLPHAVTLVSFTARDAFPSVNPPANVRFEFQPYADSERAVVQAFGGVDATYLGLWTDADRRLFGETSLSSKLTTYAAAARPVIVDAAPESVAWRLVGQFDAGLRLEGQGERDAAALAGLFTDAARWERMAAGAQKLCLEHFDLDRNVTRLKEQLCRNLT